MSWRRFGEVWANWVCRGKERGNQYRWAEDRYDRLPAMAAELVRDKVAVIVAGHPSALANAEIGGHNLRK
jgi:hypothetical protein